MVEIPVEVIRSERRHKTVQAYLRHGKLLVMIPDHLTAEQEAEIVEKMKTKAFLKMATVDIDLGSRAMVLSKRYGLPTPTSIEWSERQLRRWGSCTTSNGTIRISSRLASVPVWVLDSVIVHELAHLTAPDHGSEFRTLTSRYPYTERATGYLMAISAEETMPGIDS